MEQELDSAQPRVVAATEPPPVESPVTAIPPAEPVRTVELPQPAATPEGLSPATEAPPQAELPRVEPAPFVVERPAPPGDGAWSPQAVEVEDADDEPEAEPDEEATAPAAVVPGPNLMLALVCWVASATSLFEAVALFQGHHVHTYAFTGYLALGIGILLFSFEAVAWARSQRRWTGWLYLPAAALTILGVVSLVLSHAPGRRI